MGRLANFEAEGVFGVFEDFLLDYGESKLFAGDFCPIRVQIKVTEANFQRKREIIYFLAIVVFDLRDFSS